MMAAENFDMPEAASDTANETARAATIVMAVAMGALDEAIFLARLMICEREAMPAVA